MQAGFDRSAFFDSVRASLFGGRLSTRQVAGLDAILDGCARLGGSETGEAVAYILATAFHETAATMQPVRETLAASDTEAIARLERAFAAGRLPSVKTPYWRPDREGRSWLGRGFVQLTHRRNYEKMAALTGVDLTAAPERAMEMGVAVTILVAGMQAGSFTGYRLADHFRPGMADWEGARRIINGRDRAGLVAGYGRAFRQALG